MLLENAVCSAIMERSINGFWSFIQADEQTTPRKRTFRKFTYRGIDLEQLLDLSSEQVISDMIPNNAEK